MLTTLSCSVSFLLSLFKKKKKLCYSLDSLFCRPSSLLLSMLEHLTILRHTITDLDLPFSIFLNTINISQTQSVFSVKVRRGHCCSGPLYKQQNSRTRKLTPTSAPIHIDAQLPAPPPQPVHSNNTQFPWRSRNSPVNKVNRLWRDDRRIVVHFLVEAMFSFCAACGRTQGTARPPIQWVTGPFRGVNTPKREANHSSPSRAEVKTGWNYTSTTLGV